MIIAQNTQGKPNPDSEAKPLFAIDSDPELHNQGTQNGKKPRRTQDETHAQLERNMLDERHCTRLARSQEQTIPIK
jgi:hypothetical protein